MGRINMQSLISLAFLDNRIASSKSRWLTVIANCKGRPVATCDLSCWGKQYVWIMSLSVQKKHRGCGIGTMMLRACIEKCVAAKKSAILIAVHKKNRRAEKLY